MMKKWMALLLVFLLGTAVMACSNGAAPDDDYPSWTKSDWDAASDDQQMEASRYVLSEIGDSIAEGFSDALEQTDGDQDAEAAMNERVETMRDSIADFFESASDSETLGEMVESIKAMFAAQ